MRKLSYLFTLTFGCLFVVGCHESGTWKDNAKNWQRIFRTSKPASVVVVHSQFWRSPHWTYEFEYFLQVAPNDEFKKTLFQLNKMKQLKPKDESQDVLKFFSEKPKWFLPKSISNYEIWIYEGEPTSNFKILIDRDTQDLFFTDYSV